MTAFSMLGNLQSPVRGDVIRYMWRLQCYFKIQVRNQHADMFELDAMF